MADTRQGGNFGRPGGTLARTHEGKPGLPRGRSRLPDAAVRASQRARLLHSAIAAVARLGYPAVTVADIVRGARVSRAAFYAHFADKEECFLAATRAGGDLMTSRVIAATRSARTADPAPPARDPATPARDPVTPARDPATPTRDPATPTRDEAVLRAACRAFLAFLADEPAFARVFYVEMHAAGPRAGLRLHAAAKRFAKLNRAWHERARLTHPGWPRVSDEAYLALVGATAELIRARVREGRTDSLPDLEDALVNLHLSVLAARPWPTADALPTVVRCTLDTSCQICHRSEISCRP